ncbi:hypothetical protein H696_05224 [Fonticula alba]|uniref:RING-type E3 ubiquitin transferase n=1 Tax=Fonticula alba TaxID=691883 RepID=A0A058Z2E1_FONAL|nr:hypothetical protein H696_05224 [Fonticula alba]KCV68306.1 hypothetical protein H696_05224 [Fonticula alba]|eukprot:XP_009497360.1 hypothetical protein H696_05224 [Fonticula alba]
MADPTSPSSPSGQSSASGSRSQEALRLQRQAYLERIDSTPSAEPAPAPTSPALAPSQAPMRVDPSPPPGPATLGDELRNHELGYAIPMLERVFAMKLAEQGSAVTSPVQPYADASFTPGTAPGDAARHPLLFILDDLHKRYQEASSPEQAALLLKASVDVFFLHTMHHSIVLQELHTFDQMTWSCPQLDTFTGDTHIFGLILAIYNRALEEEKSSRMFKTTAPFRMALLGAIKSVAVSYSSLVLSSDDILMVTEDKVLPTDVLLAHILVTVTTTTEAFSSSINPRVLPSCFIPALVEHTLSQGDGMFDDIFGHTLDALHRGAQLLASASRSPILLEHIITHKTSTQVFDDTVRFVGALVFLVRQHPAIIAKMVALPNWSFLPTDRIFSGLPRELLAGGLLNNQDSIFSLNIQMASFLGPFFSFSFFPKDTPFALDYFFGPIPHRPEAIIRHVSMYGTFLNKSTSRYNRIDFNVSIKRSFDQYHTHLHDLTFLVLKAHRDNMLAFLEAVVQANASRTQLQVNPARLTSLGMAYNVLAVLLRLCHPILEDEPFPPLAPDALTFCQLKAPMERFLDPWFWLQPAGRPWVKDATRWAASDAQVSSVEAYIDSTFPDLKDKPPAFVTRLFFMTFTMIHRTLIPILNQYKEYSGPNSQRPIQDALQALQDEYGSGGSLDLAARLRALPPAAMRNVTIAVYQSEMFYRTLSILEAAVLPFSAAGESAMAAEPATFGLPAYVSRFLATASKWLLSLLGGFQTLPLRTPPSDLVRCLPEWLLETVLDWFNFVISAIPAGVLCRTLSGFDAGPFRILSGIAPPVDFLVTLATVLLYAPMHIRNPYLRDKFTEFLFSLLHVSSSQLPPFWALVEEHYPEPAANMGLQVIMRNATARRWLFPMAMAFYQEVEHTGSSHQFFTKFSIRYRLACLVNVLWISDPANTVVPSTIPLSNEEAAVLNGRFSSQFPREALPLMQLAGETPATTADGAAPSSASSGALAAPAPSLDGSLSKHPFQESLLAEFLQTSHSSVSAPGGSFVRFVNLLMNDATFLLDEALRHLAQIHTHEQEHPPGADASTFSEGAAAAQRTPPPPPATPARARRDPNAQGEPASDEEESEGEEDASATAEQTDINTIRSRAYSSVSLSFQTLLLFRNLSGTIREPFLRPEIVDRLVAMLNYNLSQLVGPKCTELKVHKPEQYGFKPINFLQVLLSTYLHLSADLDTPDSAMLETASSSADGSLRGVLPPTGGPDSDEEEEEDEDDLLTEDEKHPFLVAMAKDERSFDARYFTTASLLLRNRLQKSDHEIDALLRMSARVQALRAALAEDMGSGAEASGPYDDSSDIPEDLLDPITFALMTDPVMLPSSRMVVDRSTIQTHLLSDPTDPFNRSPLTAEQLLPAPEIRKKVRQHLAQKRKERRLRIKQATAAAAATTTTTAGDTRMQDL